MLVGAYSVGKERIFKALAKELDARLWTTSARSEVWKCLRDPGLLERKVENREEARVQVVDNKMINWGGLAKESSRVGELFRYMQLFNIARGEIEDFFTSGMCWE